ncbi:Major royal jelly protein 2 [Eumeta japonica]|uniref:Major royal jelly protein 2 n=1 Tax=Eumeta variegata TaxID=151549 RepID=A0A4C1XIN7_EUMVA|nr:Major royal jelly protein 2 [Eumeta japonica]
MKAKPHGRVSSGRSNERANRCPSLFSGKIYCRASVASKSLSFISLVASTRCNYIACSYIRLAVPASTRPTFKLRSIFFPRELLRPSSLLTNIVLDDTSTPSGHQSEYCDHIFAYISDTVAPAIGRSSRAVKSTRGDLVQEPSFPRGHRSTPQLMRTETDQRAPCVRRCVAFSEKRKPICYRAGRLHIIRIFAYTPAPVAFRGMADVPFKLSLVCEFTSEKRQHARSPRRDWPALRERAWGVRLDTQYSARLRAIIVYDAGRDDAWRVTHASMYPDPDMGEYDIGGERFTLMDGVVGLAHSPALSLLYYQPLATDRSGRPRV